MTRKNQFKIGQDLVLLGYDGDRLARDVRVEAFKPGLVVVWDKNRRVYRSYKYNKIRGIRRVKS